MQYQCRECTSKYMTGYNAKNILLIREKTKQNLRNLRTKALALLGGKCAHCGESDPVVLDFDHINDDGAAHRRLVRANASRMVLAEPERFQLLCKNCNWRKEHTRRSVPCPT